METIELHLKIKPISLNACFSTLRDGRRVRSADYKRWVSRLRSELEPYFLQLSSFFRSYNPKLHEIHSDLVIYTPELYTVAKIISKKSGDIDNFCKPIFDNLFIFNVDDSQIVSLLIRKLVADDFRIVITLTIKSR